MPAELTVEEFVTGTGITFSALSTTSATLTVTYQEGQL